MKYVIMCGGHYKEWETPKHLTQIHGEEIVARTIRLLRAEGVQDIAISTDNPAFEMYGVPILTHANDYYARGYNDCDGHWVNAFYPTGVPTCYIFGDVIFSPAAIKTIVQTPTDDIELFGSAPPFASNYPKPYVEPFAFKVVNQYHFRQAIQQVKEYDAAGRFNRRPIAWELWQVIKGTRLNKYKKNYSVINDYTCDIDTPAEIAAIVAAIPLPD